MENGDRDSHTCMQNTITLWWSVPGSILDCVQNVAIWQVVEPVNLFYNERIIIAKRTVMKYLGELVNVAKIDPVEL